MIKLNYFKSIIAASVIVALFSCKGDTGAQGPTGATGNAAIVSVYTYKIPAGKWVTNSSYPWEIDCTLADSLINTTGEMDCYYSADSINYLQLPWITNGNAPEFEQSWVYNNTGAVTVRWYNISNNPTTAPTPPKNAWFKVVSIPTAAIKKHPNTNWYNWNEVNAVLAEQKSNSIR